METIIQIMNTKIIQECVHGSLNGTRNFPQIVMALTQEGFESYHVDFNRHECRYYMPNGESHVETVNLEQGIMNKEFSAAKVEAAVRRAQAGTATYPQFVQSMYEAGCLYYIVYLTGKKVVYMGRNGETHIELFPQSK